MKRVLSLILICSVLLCGCSTGQSSSVPQSSSVMENSSSLPQSSSATEISSASQSSSKPVINPSDKYSSDTEFRRYVKDGIMPFDSTKSDEYNNAMRIYMTYLGAAYTAEHTELIDSFCFYDMNGDDIPELIISMFYHIFVGSVNEDEGKIDWWEDTGHSATNGPTKILANGMLASRSSSTGTTFTFLEYDKNGTATRTGFFVYPTYNHYEFMGEEVTEEEFNRLAGPYLSAWENEAEVEWISYLDAVVGIPNNEPFIQPDEMDNHSAVNAYNKLLSDKFYDFNYDFSRSYSIENYGLFDMNSDGMPELILRIRQGFFIDNEIWSYIDGQLVQFDTPPMWTMNGRIEILSNGMIGYNSRDLTHRFYIYGKDGSRTEKSFGKWNGSFSVDGTSVTEEEYNTRIAPYLPEIEKKAEIDWRPYFEEQ